MSDIDWVRLRQLVPDEHHPLLDELRAAHDGASDEGEEALLDVVDRKLAEMSARFERARKGD